MPENRSATEQRFGWKKTILYSLLPVLVMLTALEVGARIVEIWVPPLPVDLGQGFSPESRLFVPSEGDSAVLVTNPSKGVSFQQRAFQAAKPPGTLRVFALGGSSVKYLDYEFPLLADRLTDRLSAKYNRAEIINCGGLSYGSHRLVRVAAEILGYTPDLVLIYSAHNEFEELEQLGLANLETVPIQRVLAWSALYRFMRDRIAAQQIARLEAARNRRTLADTIPDASKTWNHPFTDQEIEERMRAYRGNLARSIELCQSYGVPVVLGTAPSNLMKPSLPGKDGTRYQEVLDLFAQGKYAEGARLGRQILRHATPRHQASDAENEIIRSLAKEYGIPLADVETAIIKAEPHHVPGETLFSDHCHLSPEGNKILIAAYEREILRVFGSDDAG